MVERIKEEQLQHSAYEMNGKYPTRIASSLTIFARREANPVSAKVG